MNRMTEPSVTLIQGIDFILTPGALTLRTDPFLNPNIPTTPIWANGQIVDQQADLWLFRPQFDQQTVYEQFGYLLRLRTKESSEEYRQLVNSLLDAIVGGTTENRIRLALSAITGTPLTREAQETVEDVFLDNDGLVVVTDQHAYRFPAEANPVVAIGDVVLAGDPLTDAVTFYEFNRGQTPDAVQVPALALGRGVLAAGYYSDLVFPNKTVPWVITTDPAGQTRMSFEIGGFPTDVTQFWDSVHEAGVASGRTLANLLDTRTNKVGEPTAATLPATVNPLQFLCQNLLRDNAFLVRVRPEALGANAVGLEYLRVLRKIIPPQTLMFVLVELTYTDDPVTLDGPGTETAPGYEEVVSSYLGGDVVDAIDPATFIAETVRARSLIGRCE